MLYFIKNSLKKDPKTRANAAELLVFYLKTIIFY